MDIIRFVRPSRSVKRRIQGALRKRGYELTSTSAPVWPEVRSREFDAAHDAVRPFTKTSRDRMYALFHAARYLARRPIPGAIAECGVWKGGSMMLVARALLLERTTRPLYLYDTFSGMSEPTGEDPADARERWEIAQRADGNDWCYAPLEEVKANLEGTGYPSDQVHYVVGKVEDTIPATAPDELALLRLDTDWYESTLHELVHLYPRLVTGGILIIDDYGHWEGARRAVDEYFQDEPVLLNRLDYAGRLVIKP